MINQQSNYQIFGEIDVEICGDFDCNRAARLFRKKSEEIKKVIPDVKVEVVAGHFCGAFHRWLELKKNEMVVIVDPTYLQFHESFVKKLPGEKTKYSEENTEKVKKEMGEAYSIYFIDDVNRMKKTFIGSSNYYKRIKKD